MTALNIKRVGNFIRELRKEKKLSQEELAQKLCDRYLQTTAKTVSDWEVGKTLPEIEKIEELCKILGVTMDELMDGERSDDINLLEKYSILDKPKIDELLKDKTFNYFNKLQEQYMLVFETMNCLLNTRIDREFTYKEEKEFSFLVNHFYQTTEYCDKYASKVIKNPYIKLKHAIRNLLKQAENLEKDEIVWEIRKFINPIEDIDIRFFFSGDSAPEKNSIIDKRFKSLEFWQKDMILATIQSVDPIYDWSQSGSRNLKRYEEQTGKKYDMEQEIRGMIKYLIDNGACINENYLNFYRIIRDEKRIIDRVEELYDLCKKPLDFYFQSDGKDKHYKAESTPKNRFLSNYILLYSLNNSFNERSEEEWFNIIQSNEEIPQYLMLEMAKKNNIDINRDWRYVEADLNIFLLPIKKHWKQFKEKEKKIESGSKELDFLVNRMESGEKYYRVTSKEFCGGKTLSELRDCFYYWNEFFALNEMKQSRLETKTKELLKNLDKLNLLEIRELYFKPLEVDDNEE